MKELRKFVKWLVILPLLPTMIILELVFFVRHKTAFEELTWMDEFFEEPIKKFHKVYTLGILLWLFILSVILF